MKDELGVGLRGWTLCVEELDWAAMAGYGMID
jgi:hypothetical protein